MADAGSAPVRVRRLYAFEIEGGTMARRKTLPESIRAKYALAERLTALRHELFGDRGGPELARRLGLPIRTWYNYEAGVTVPAEVVLRLIELTAVEPGWLLRGVGPKYRARGADMPGWSEPTSEHERSANTLIRRALEMLESAAQREGAAPGALPAPRLASRNSDGGPSDPADAREWFNAERGCRYVRVSGEAMSPIATDGAYVAYVEDEEPFQVLDGNLVVAWLEGEPIVRWFEKHGRYAILRAENGAVADAQRLIDLEADGARLTMRRVRWVNTPH